LKIWNTTNDDVTASETLREQKRMKTENSRMVTKVPMVTLSGHREAVTGSCWSDTAESITASMDRSIIVWDLELAGQKNVLTCSKAFTSLAYSPLNHMLISGSADRHVRLWDPRSKEGAMVKATFSSHTGWVVDVDWSKTNEFLFVSASYDNLMKMWDTRSPKAPLFDLTGHEDRLLCCDWSIPSRVLSGGADNSVKIFRTNQSSGDNETWTQIIPVFIIWDTFVIWKNKWIEAQRIQMRCLKFSNGKTLARKAPRSQMKLLHTKKRGNRFSPIKKPWTQHIMSNKGRLKENELTIIGHQHGAKTQWDGWVKTVMHNL